MVVLEYMERVEKWNREDRELRLALMQSGALSPAQAFPELDVNDEEGGDEEFGNDSDAITYVFADQSKLDPAEVERELRELAMAAANGTMSFEDTTDYSDWV